jgi:serine protease Do
MLYPTRTPSRLSFDLENNMSPKHLKQTFIASAVVGVLAAGYARFGEHVVSPATATVAPVQVPVASATSGVAMALPDFAGIVVQNGPAVVNISVSGTRQIVDRGLPEMDPNDPFQQFFRQFQPPMPQGGMPVQGMGSGFIVRNDGVVITNAHVVEGASDVTVKLTDKREFKAKVIGVDKPTDTAVLKIDAKDLPTVKLGDPGQIGVGEWVLAIGSPFGFENSVTAGIVSAKSRSLPDEGYVPFIQTDVAVNPGNSGGPLFNLKGEVIGINSQIYTRSGGYQGVSFAIPINVAMKVEQQLLQDGKVSRGRLGVGVQDLNQPLAESFGLEKPVGALVDSVPNDGPAAKAGIQPGDIILRLDGKEIRDSGQLPPLVADLKPGSEAILTILRNGESKEIALKIGESKETQQSAAEPEALTKGRLGLAVRPLGLDALAESDVRGGLLVERVAGVAARAGLQPGDVVLAVNGQPVTEPEQLRDLAAKADKRIALLVQRGNSRMYVPIDLS